jgi:hypothetical protein
VAKRAVLSNAKMGNFASGAVLLPPILELLCSELTFILLDIVIEKILQI